MGWTAILAIVLFSLVMTRTTIGRAFYAVGGILTLPPIPGSMLENPSFVHLLFPELAGLTGYLWVSRYAVAYVDIAGGFELDVVAACVIGGVSIVGGIGTVAGAVLGGAIPWCCKNATRH